MSWTQKEKTKYRSRKKWKDFRLALIKKHENCCEICGIKKRGKQTKYLQIHHINPESYGHESEEDVAVICSADHQLLERLLRRKEFDIDKYCVILKELYRKTKANEKQI